MGKRPPEEAGRQQEAGLCRGQGAKPLDTRSTSLTSFPKHRDKIIKNFKMAPSWALCSNGGAVLSTHPVQRPCLHAHEAGPPCWARGSRQQQAARWVPPWGLGAGKEEVKVQETSHSTGLYQGEVALKSFQTQRVSPEEPACDTQPPRGLRAGQGAEIGPPNG